MCLSPRALTRWIACSHAFLALLLVCTLAPVHSCTCALLHWLLCTLASAGASCARNTGHSCPFSTLANELKARSWAVFRLAIDGTPLFEAGWALSPILLGFVDHLDRFYAFDLGARDLRLPPLSGGDRSSRGRAMVPPLGGLDILWCTPH